MSPPALDSAPALTAPAPCRLIAPLPVLVIWALLVMFASAFRVRLLALFHVTLLATTILPVDAAADVVSTITLVLPSAVVRSPAFSVDVAAVLPNVPPARPIPPELAAPLIVISVGSSSRLPVAPCAADVLTLPANASVALPDVSTKPPSPPCAPPLAEIAPPKPVCWSAHTTTLPPLPLVRASALMTAPASTCVKAAVLTPPAPCRSPPTSALPPPVSPETSMLAPASTATLSPSTLTAPPPSPAPAPLAASVPLTFTTPALPPSMTIWPFLSTIEPARTMPLVLITVSSTALAELALMNTLPPSALTLPEFTTAALAVAASTLMVTSLSPAMSSETRPPAASAVVPPVVTMLPALVTCGAASMTKAPRSWPKLATSPDCAPASNLYLPDRKLALLMFMLVATRPPTSTLAPGAK